MAAKIHSTTVPGIGYVVSTGEKRPHSEDPPRKLKHYVRIACQHWAFPTRDDEGKIHLPTTCRFRCGTKPA